MGCVDVWNVRMLETRRGKQLPPGLAVASRPSCAGGRDPNPQTPPSHQGRASPTTATASPKRDIVGCRRGINIGKENSGRTVGLAINHGVVTATAAGDILTDQRIDVTRNCRIAAASRPSTMPQNRCKPCPETFVNYASRDT